MTTLKLVPRATEKAYSQSLDTNTYVFNVPLSANRQQVTDAIEEQFSVDVVKIRTLVQSGKTKRFSRGGNRYPGTTVRSDIKKAYVTLKEGQKINVFDDIAKEAEGAE